jgi:hypothetical protein
VLGDPLVGAVTGVVVDGAGLAPSDPEDVQPVAARVNASSRAGAAVRRRMAGLLG